MEINDQIEAFLSRYDEPIYRNVLTLRQVLLDNLPGVSEVLDLPAKMLAYCYGQKYVDLICIIIPSKKGLKLGFNRGTELHDPNNLLEGNGKISRYVVITSDEQIHSDVIQQLLINALSIYRQKTSTTK